MDVQALNQQLSALYGGYDWVVVADVAAAATPNVDALREWGVERVMVVAATEGTGTPPEADAIHYTRSYSPSMMGGFRAFALSLKTEKVKEAIARFDREAKTRILAPPFGAEAVFDPPAYGERRREWMALEDKMTVDRLFEDAGVPTAPSEVVEVAEAAAVGRRLASADGAVWVADNTEGWHGGGEYVRWVRSVDDECAATAWFGEHSLHVRVMPFLEGVPCSIHGFIAGPGDVAVFRPVEMLIARDLGGPGFQYLGMSTLWDPASAMRDQMREVARSVAHHLDEIVDFRGPFSVDGVATATGFLPTELNPRMSSGFGIQAGTATSLRIGLLTRAVIEGDVEISATDLEALVVRSADAKRVLRALAHTPEAHDAGSIPVRIDGDTMRPADLEPDGTIELAPSAGGSVAMLKVETDRLAVGRSAAPLAVSMARLASETWDLGLPELYPALPAPFAETHAT